MATASEPAPASASPAPDVTPDAPDGAPGAVLARVRRLPVFHASLPVLEELLGSGRWPSLSELERVVTRAARTHGAIALDEAALVRCEADRGGRRRRGPRARADLYDAQIAERRVLPTRPENWHDLFNVVTWATFPHAKRALHARQFRRLCERVPEHIDRLPGARSAEQSALTQLDEGGVLLSLPEHVTDAVREELMASLRDLAQRRAALDERHLVASGARCRVFGHALLEHLALGGPLPRAALVVLTVPPGDLDQALARLLDADDQPFALAPATAWMTPNLATRG